MYLDSMNLPSLQKKKKKEKKKKKYPKTGGYILYGRSDTHRHLPYISLIPVFGYFMRGTSMERNKRKNNSLELSGSTYFVTLIPIVWVGQKLIELLLFNRVWVRFGPLDIPRMMVWSRSSIFTRRYHNYIHKVTISLPGWKLFSSNIKLRSHPPLHLHAKSDLPHLPYCF